MSCSDNKVGAIIVFKHLTRSGTQLLRHGSIALGDWVSGRHNQSRMRSAQCSSRDMMRCDAVYAHFIHH